MTTDQLNVIKENEPITNIGATNKSGAGGGNNQDFSVYPGFVTCIDILDGF